MLQNNGLGKTDFNPYKEYSAKEEKTILEVCKARARLSLKGYISDEELYKDLECSFVPYALNVDEAALSKGIKPFPIGTIRHWTVGDHIKIAQDRWASLDIGPVPKELEILERSLELCPSIDELWTLIKYNEDKFPSSYKDIYSLLGIIGDLKDIVQYAKKYNRSIREVIEDRNCIWSLYIDPAHECFTLPYEVIVKDLDKLSSAIEYKDGIKGNIQELITRSLCAAWRVTSLLVPRLPSLDKLIVEDKEEVDTKDSSAVAKVTYTGKKIDGRHRCYLTICQEAFNEDFLVTCALNNIRRRAGKRPKTVCRREVAYVDAFLHEMGHIVLDMLRLLLEQNTGKDADVFEQVFNIKDSYDRSLKGDTFPSVYSKNNLKEHFAECYSLYITRRHELMPYQNNMISDVIRRVKDLAKAYVLKGIPGRYVYDWYNIYEVDNETSVLDIEGLKAFLDRLTPLGVPIQAKLAKEDYDYIEYTAKHFNARDIECLSDEEIVALYAARKNYRAYRNEALGLWIITDAMASNTLAKRMEKIDWKSLSKDGNYPYKELAPIVAYDEDMDLADDEEGEVEETKRPIKKEADSTQINDILQWVKDFVEQPNMPQ